MRGTATFRSSLPYLWVDSRIRAHAAWPCARGMEFESNRSPGGGWNIGNGNSTFGFCEFRAAGYAGPGGGTQALGADGCAGIRRVGGSDLDCFVDLSGYPVEMGERIKRGKNDLLLEVWFSGGG